MPTYVWKNRETGELVETFNSIANRDVPPEEPGDWERAITPPNFPRKSFLDGQRVKSDKGLAALKQAGQMEIEYANSDSKSEKAEIRKAITEIKTVK